MLVALVVSAGGAMAAVPCTSCATTLLAHCTSKQCHWYRCPSSACQWWIYDLQHGVRVNGTGNKVEQIGAPPVIEYPETDQA